MIHLQTDERIIAVGFLPADLGAAANYDIGFGLEYVRRVVCQFYDAGADGDVDVSFPDANKRANAYRLDGTVALMCLMHSPEIVVDDKITFVRTTPVGAGNHVLQITVIGEKDRYE